jgi:anti-anti-sigma factor
MDKQAAQQHIEIPTHLEPEVLEPSVLRPDGELGVTELRALAQHCFRCAQEGQLQLVLDLSYVDHLDYRGVGMLIAARQLLRRQGGDLVLASASGYLQAILRAAGSFGKLEICATVEAARARFFVELSL